MTWYDVFKHISVLRETPLFTVDAGWGVFLCPQKRTNWPPASGYKKMGDRYSSDGKKPVGAMNCFNMHPDGLMPVTSSSRPLVILLWSAFAVLAYATAPIKGVQYACVFLAIIKLSYSNFNTQFTDIVNVVIS